MSGFTRRHFLKGSGLGFAGLAAASLNGVGFGRAQAVAIQDSPAAGQAVIIKRGAITLHSYVAPEASLSVTTHIIETPESLIVVDAQFVQAIAAEAAAYVGSLGKPVSRHLLSHAHPDHFAGANQFGETPFVATPAVAAAVQTYIDDGSLRGLAAFLGEDAVPSDEDARVPEGSVEAGETVIDGVTLTIEIVQNAESPEQLIIGVPEARTLIVQDLLYSNSHFFPGTDRNRWIETLESLRARTDFDTLLVGHGLPVSRGELDGAIEYLTFVQETAAAAESADEIVAALIARYPTYTGGGILSFWQQFFIPA